MENRNCYINNSSVLIFRISDLKYGLLREIVGSLNENIIARQENIIAQENESKRLQEEKANAGKDVRVYSISDITTALVVSSAASYELNQIGQLAAYGNVGLSVPITISPQKIMQLPVGCKPLYTSRDHSCRLSAGSQSQSEVGFIFINANTGDVTVYKPPSVTRTDLTYVSFDFSYTIGG